MIKNHIFLFVGFQRDTPITSNVLPCFLIEIISIVLLIAYNRGSELLTPDQFLNTADFLFNPSLLNFYKIKIKEKS